KIYRDLKNALETAKEEGKFEGRDERSTEIAMEMIKNGETDEKTALYTGLSEDTIKKLRKRISL
ncbi:MAG: transposase, partial [Chitinispirillaceae bacterium]